MMTKFKMDNNLWIDDIANGSGSLKNYDYICQGLFLKSKNSVYKAIKLKLPIIRIEKNIMLNNRSEFDYKLMRFK